MSDSGRFSDSDATFGGAGASPTLGGGATAGGAFTSGGATGGGGGDDGGEVTTIDPGTVLAGRYQIIRLLGVGGMGAVYQAFDRQLARVVALKTIIPEMAATPAMLKRFKSEILLAQKITHKNVVRIFDMSEDGATKFITMDYIEGEDLKHVVVRQGKLEPAEAIRIMRQVLEAIEAAHGVGVVHRDLKPQNIMMGAEGQIVVMDFGIAGSQQSRGATQTGQFLGTPEYMSPEQARSEEVDARSDIFALGLIFYELLTGKLAFQGKSVLETMFMRTKERAIPPAEIDRNVPAGANDIIVKCLEPEREKRYQAVTEILNDFEVLDPNKKTSATAQVRAKLRKASRYRNWAAAAVAVIAIAIAAYVVRTQFVVKPTAQHAPMNVLIADFSNHTGDALFDGTLEPAVRMALEGAGFITAFDRLKVSNLGVKAPEGKMDGQVAQQLAINAGVGVVLTGSLDRQGNGYVLSLKASEAVTGKQIKIAEESATNKDQVMYTLTRLTITVRKALGDDTSDSAQRFAMESLSAASLESVHEYAMGMDALSNGRYEDALRSFSKAVDIDQNFGLAYAGMATASRNLEQPQDADKYIQLALNHIDSMTERERLRTRAAYYVVTGKPEKCVEEYNALIGRFPSDAGAHNNVANCWSQLQNMPKALEEQRQAAAILPKRSLYRFNTAMFASYSSDFQAGEKEARALLEMDPSYSDVFTALGFSQLGQGQLPQAAESFEKLADVGKVGASDSTAGLADLAIYQGRFDEAAGLLEKGAAADEGDAKTATRAAAKYAELAYTRLLQKKNPQAIAAAEKAMKISNAVRIRFLAARIFVATGQTAKAQKLAEDLASGIQKEPQADAKLIEGELALASGDAQKAIKAFTDANTLLNTWIGRFDLGRAYLEAGLFPEADSEFDQCIKRRGEALTLSIIGPTYGFFPHVYYYIGRVREGMKSQGFADSYRTYLSIREKAGEDPLLSDIKKRLGS